MKQMVLLLLLASTFLFACKKQGVSDSATTKKADVKTPEPMYFDLKSNPDVKVPAKFTSFKEAVDFMTKNYKRVNKDGSQYGALTGKNARTSTTADDDGPPYIEVSAPNSGATSGLETSGQYSQSYDYNISSFNNTNRGDFCQEWLTFDPYIDPFGGGVIHIYESLEAEYAQRGIICVLNFNVKYAPGPYAGNTSSNLVYANGDYLSLYTLTITGGALGAMGEAGIQLNMNRNGTGTIYAHQVETRTYIRTNKNKEVLKAGGSENWPIGMALENGESVAYSSTSVTSYTLIYQLTYYDYNVYHFHDLELDGSVYCTFNSGRPFLVYQDIGSAFVGIPRN